MICKAGWATKCRSKARASYMRYLREFGTCTCVHTSLSIHIVNHGSSLTHLLSSPIFGDSPQARVLTVSLRLAPRYGKVVLHMRQSKPTDKTEDCPLPLNLSNNGYNGICMGISIPISAEKSSTWPLYHCRNTGRQKVYTSRPLPLQTVRPSPTYCELYHPRSLPFLL